MKIKKNDKAYLQDFKIDIRTDRDDYYQELVLLFDKPQFLNLLPYLRTNFRIVDLFPLENFNEEFDYHTMHQFEIGTKLIIDLSKYSNISKLKESFPLFHDLIINESDFFPEKLDAECNLICYEFNRPPYFVEVIKQAICCGAVDDTHFKPTEASIVNFELMGSWPTLERIAIFISPTSTYEDVKEEFRKARELIKSDKRLSYYQPQSDIAPNIRKYRDWYWKRIKGETCQVIADEWVEKHENETTTYLDVLKAVKTYEKLLAS